MTNFNVDDGIIIRIFATNKTISDLSLSEKKILVIFSFIRAMRNHFYAESFSCNLWLTINFIRPSLLSLEYG